LVFPRGPSIQRLLLEDGGKSLKKHYWRLWSKANFKLGCFAVDQVEDGIHERPHLELTAGLKFCPLSYNLLGSLRRFYIQPNDIQHNDTQFDVLYCNSKELSFHIFFLQIWYSINILKNCYLQNLLRKLKKFFFVNQKISE
jgi:hypothetical protein